jgi:hypothetical protein
MQCVPSELNSTRKQGGGLHEHVTTSLCRNSVLYRVCMIWSCHPCRECICYTLNGSISRFLFLWEEGCRGLFPHAHAHDLSCLRPTSERPSTCATGRRSWSCFRRPTPQVPVPNQCHRPLIYQQ